MSLRLLFLILAIIVFTSATAFGQEKRWKQHELGINLLQLPATTLDLTYELSGHPRYSMVFNAGYTINYSKSIDYLGFFLSPHYKCGNDGYSMKKQTGGFIKAGLKYNFRSTMEKPNYFFLGGFIAGSVVSERAEYRNMEIQDSPVEALSHTVFIPGLTAATGYHFMISEKLSSDVGVHISFPSKNYRNLFGYSNYIPGMGYMETCANERIFPLLVWNLKYSLH